MSIRVFLPGNILKSISERPECRNDDINEIIEGVERYNPLNATVLEEYLRKQCSENSYDGLANLALLKLYQFNPHLVKEDIITALCYYSRSDFTLCLHLLPSKLLASFTVEAGQASAPLAEFVRKLYHLFNLLNYSEYAKFWQDFQKDPIYSELTSECIGFQTTIRLRITQHIDQTMHCIDLELLKKWLCLSNDNYKEWIHEAGWTNNGSDVKIPKSRDKETLQKVTTEKIQLTDMTKIINHSITTK